MRQFAAGIAGAVLCLAASAAEPPDVRRWVDDGIATGEVLSIAAAWRTGDDVEQAFGGARSGNDKRPPDAATQYQIGSITKVFTNLLLAELAARGDVRYETTVRDLLGDAPDYVNPAVGDITLGALATHTSGLPRLPANLAVRDARDPYATYDAALLERGVGNSRALQPLGEHYAYSNFGVGLLGYLLGKAHGGGYEAALEAHVLEPLGLAETGFRASGNVATGFAGGAVVPPWRFDALAGAGALWGTTGDLLALTDIMLGRRDNPLEADIDALLSPTGIDAGPYSVTRVWHTAPAGDATIYWHNGGTGGFRSFVGFRPDEGRAIALLVAGDGDPTGFGLQWLGRSASAATAEPVDSAVIGAYQLAPGFLLRIFEADGRLSAQASGQPSVHLSPMPDGWYAIDTVDASLHVIRDGDAVTAVELVQNGVRRRGPRVSDSGDAPAAERVTLSDDALEAFVGVYDLVGAPAQFTIRRGGEALEAQLTGQSFVPVFAKGDDIFFYEVVEAELHFERDDDGNVVALMLHQGPIRQRAVKRP